MCPFGCEAIDEIKATNLRHLTVDYETAGCRFIMGFEELATRTVGLDPKPG